MRSQLVAVLALTSGFAVCQDGAAQDLIANLQRHLTSDKKPVRLQAVQTLGNCGKG